jgi:hypothetical protein
VFSAVYRAEFEKVGQPRCTEQAPDKAERVTIAADDTQRLGSQA